MKIYEILLVLIDELGGKVSGRTLIQKLCYFFSIKHNKNMGFKPHYYGPYSPYVEKALDELEGIGLFDKTVELLGESSSGFEIKRYDYVLTKYGKQAVSTIAQSDEKEKVVTFASKIKRHGIPSTEEISVAAKSYFILNRERSTLTDNQIKGKASDFDWDITEDSINRASDFLVKMELVKRQ